MGISIPKFEIQAKQVESATEINLISVGFGIHNAWTYAAMYGASILFRIDGQALGGTLNLLFYASLAVFSITLFVISWLDCRIPFSARWSVLIAGSTVGMCAGTFLLLFLSAFSGALAVALLVLSSMLTGIGSALLIVMWGIKLASYERATIVGNVALSFVVAAVIHVLLVSVVPYPFAGIAAACLPLFEAAVLFATEKNRPKGTEAFALPPLPMRKSRVVVRLVLPFALICTGLSLLKSSYALDIISGEAPVPTWCLIAATTIAFLVLFLCIRSISKMPSSDAVLRPALCVAAPAALLVPFVGPGCSPIVCTLVIAGYFTLEAAMFTYPCVLSQECRISTPFLFGLIRGCMALCVVIVGVLKVIVGDWSNLAWGASSLTVVVLLCLLLGYALFPNQGLIARKAAVDAKAQPDIDFDTLSMRQDESPASDSPASSATEHAGQEESRDAFQRRCEIVANRNLLSRREAEVLVELANGYNCSRIQEDLCIAEGTVRTHIRHIYEKLGIHSQQELIRLVEDQVVG